MRKFTEAEQCAVAIVYGAKDQEPLPVSSLGREARIRRESDREDATNPVCSPEAAEDARQALDGETALLTAEEIAALRNLSLCWTPGENLPMDRDYLARIVATLEAITDEVTYLRRQIGLDENHRDPEFYGCEPDPHRPAHLPR